MREIISWKGTKAIDKDGKEYIDLTAGGIFSAMFGPGSAIIKKAISGINHFCSYAPHYGNYWRDKYYQLLRDLTGFECAVAFCEGSIAVEAFWRCCRAYNGKPGIWGGLVDPDTVGQGGKGSPSDQFHGWTLGSMIAAGKINWPEMAIWPELGAGRFGTDPNRTACMIMEPYHAASGQFHRVDPTINRIKEMQLTYPDIPLCVDEIQGGFGRTGKLFAYEHYDDLSPDFVTIGKLAGGGFPLSVLLGPAEIMESDSVKEFGHLHSTHSGNPMACAVGCAVIEEMIALDLINESARKGVIIKNGLRNLPVRSFSKGLLAGIEFSDQQEAGRVVEKCRDRGLLVIDTGRKWVKVGPALIIEDETLEEGIKILSEVIQEVTSERNVAPCGGSGQEPRGIGADLSVPGVQADQPGEIGSPENGGREGEGD